MKKFYSLAILLCSPAAAFPQWTQLSSGVTDSLRSVYFLNDTLGWVCGESAMGDAPILKTTNGGTTWSLTIYPTAKQLRAIQFLDQDTGVIVGWKGLILRSTDGGVTWDSIPSGTTKSLRNMYFPSHDTGYACGGGGTILKTIDAGLTWSPQVSGVSNELVNIRFLNNDVGYAVRKIAGDFLDGYVIKTTDGGATWTIVYTNPAIGLLGVAIADDSTTYVGGNNQTIIKTSDAGATWNQMYSGIAGYPIRGGDFVSADTGWMVGGSDGAILYTDNGGATWTNQDTLTGIDFLAIHFPNSKVGFTVGSEGTILKYNKPCGVLALPDSITGPTSVCAHDTVAFSIDSIAGANSYVWQVIGDAVITSGDSSNFITVLFGNSPATILVSVFNSCDNVATSLVVAVSPLPAPPVITFLNDTLISSPASTYQWYYNGIPISAATDQSYAPMQIGFYSVTISNAFGCKASSLLFDVVALEAGAVKASSGLKIFPNPLLTTSIISIEGNYSEQFLCITDVRGKILYELEVNANERIIIHKKDFTEGMYFVFLMNYQSAFMATIKFVVE